MSLRDQLLTAAYHAEIGAPAEGAQHWVHLLPAGTFTLRDGRGPFRLDDAAGVIEASRVPGMELVIDYDHVTDLAAPGTPNPAAGWIKELQERQDGLWGRVEWTERAAAMLKAKEYRYLSPVFTSRKIDGRVTRIIRAALTNNPAAELKAVASQQTKDKSMNELLKAVLKALGLKEDADEAAVTAAIDALKKGPSLVAIAKAAGLKDDADATAIATAVTELSTKAATARPDPTKFVPMAEFETLQVAFNKLNDDIAGDKATAAVDAAVKAGKLQPAQRDWAMEYATADLAKFNAFVEKQPVIVASGPTGPGGQPPAKGAALSGEELAICRNLGIKPEDYKKTRDAEEEAA